MTGWSVCIAEYLRHAELVSASLMLSNEVACRSLVLRDADMHRHDGRVGGRVAQHDIAGMPLVLYRRQSAFAQELGAFGQFDELGAVAFVVGAFAGAGQLNGFLIAGALLIL